MDAQQIRAAIRTPAEIRSLRAKSRAAKFRSQRAERKDARFPGNGHWRKAAAQYELYVALDREVKAGRTAWQMATLAQRDARRVVANEIAPDDRETPIAALAWRVREARKHKGMSQACVARLSGVKQAHISRFETGGDNPTLETVLRICAAVGVRIRLVEDSYGNV